MKKKRAKFNAELSIPSIVFKSNSTVKFTNGEFECKGFDPNELKEGEFIALANVFDIIDHDGDILRYGAFTKTLSENKIFPLLYQHNLDDAIGTLEAIQIEKGLLIKGKFNLERDPETNKYIDNLSVTIWSRLKSSILTKFSVGMTYINVNNLVVEERHIWEVTEAKLWEVSVVTFPANEEAKLQNVKSTDDIDANLIFKYIEEHKQDNIFKSKLLALLEDKQPDNSTVVDSEAVIKMLDEVFTEAIKNV